VVVPKNLPPWLNEADLDFFTGEFKRTGFRGALNWYRNIDRNWELTGFSTARSWTSRRCSLPASATR